MLPEYLITTSLADQYLKEFFQSHNFSKIGILVDENTEVHCLPLINNSLPSPFIFKIKSGEIYKTLDTCKKIWDQMTDHGFDRHSLIINLGGGVIGDMGGFCASTFKRGIQFINIPTTLLSQVDASIGGKLGIDYGSFKNHIGIFQDPLRVIIDDRFLSTLPEKEIKSGYAEVIKHSLISDKNHWFELQKREVSTIAWKPIIKHSIAIKSRIVLEDPYESGLRKILNFGHSLGHAVESFFLESGTPLLHGEAIAIGMIMECKLSEKLCNFPVRDLENIEEYLIQTYGHYTIGRENYNNIFKRTLQDKKNKGDQLLAILLSEIGEPTEKEIKETDILQAIEYYDNIQKNV